ncbi:MAG: tol-pal system-associated acyl-CoA thioesterase [Pseudomonadota bacterium]
MHTLPLRIYYEDTDMAGVVYYANYLKFIERARSEALRTRGIDQIALKEAGLVFVVRRVVADYHAPARFDDQIQVQTAVDWVKNASVGMAQAIWRDQTRLFTAQVTVAVMTDEGRPTRLPAHVRAALSPDGEKTPPRS